MREPTAGDQLRESLGPTEVEALMPFTTRRFPSVTPEQSINRWLAEAEQTIDALASWLASQPPKEEAQR